MSLWSSFYLDPPAAVKIPQIAAPRMWPRFLCFCVFWPEGHTGCEKPETPRLRPPKQKGRRLQRRQPGPVRELAEPTPSTCTKCFLWVFTREETSELQGNGFCSFFNVSKQAKGFLDTANRRMGKDVQRKDFL